MRSPPNAARLLAPFDPVVWDRRRFELLWGWRYRFEAYTPPATRQVGCYALPLLWCEQAAGWANMRNDGDRVVAEVGFVQRRPRDAAFKRELETEFERIREFLGTAKPGRIVFRR